MHRDSQGVDEFFMLHTPKRGFEKCKLHTGQIRTLAALRRDHARIFEAVAVG